MCNYNPECNEIQYILTNEQYNGTEEQEEYVYHYYHRADKEGYDEFKEIKQYSEVTK